MGPINRGLNSQYMPDPGAEVGHCVHRIAMHPSGRTCCSCRNIGTYAQRRRGRFWHEVSGNLPTDFGFPIDVHAHEPETIYVVPIKSDSEHYPPEGKLRVYRSRQAATNGKRSRKACRRAIVTSMSCATRWRWTSSTRAACISEPRAARFMLDRCGGQLEADRARFPPFVGGSADAAMIRVVLPPHLRTLARVAAR